MSTDPRGDAAWTDPEMPPTFVGTDLTKVDDLIWSVQINLDDAHPEHPHLWHWCTRATWRQDPTKTADLEPKWALAGTGGHTLVAREPLHLEPSVYWPDCCGLHGWVRDGRWTSA